MQVELLDTRRWKTRVELANAIFESIEVFHNRRRRHSSLGMLTRSSTRRWPTHRKWHESNERLHGARGASLDSLRSDHRGFISGRFACLDASRLQTNPADFRGTGRHRTARSPDRTARNGTRRTRRHEATGLITQRSLVQIQPAQRTKPQVERLGSAFDRRGRLILCLNCVQIPLLSLTLLAGPSA